AALRHLQEDHVAIAIGPDLGHRLHVAGLLALAPEAPARARPIHRAAGARGLFQRLAVHPRDHQDPRAVRLLGDGGHQAVAIEPDRVEPVRRRAGVSGVDRGHHGDAPIPDACASCGRTGMPRAAMSRLASPTVNSPKWKMLAARTASAPPSVTPSARCSRLPTPPDAITGTGTASATARVSARSKPSRVPSRSMLVSRISP